VEPPTKRRKTNNAVSPKRPSDNTTEKAEPKVRHSVEVPEQPKSARITVQDRKQPAQTTHGDENKPTAAVVPTEQLLNPTKSPPRARRKFCLDVEAERRAQPNHERTSGLEDTFIFSPKPKKRQPKRKAAEEILADETKVISKKTVLKVRKTTKAKQQQLDDKPELDRATESARECERSTKKPKATKRKTAASQNAETVSMECTNPTEVPVFKASTHRADDSAKLLPGTDNSSEEVMVIEQELVKMKPAPKKTLKRSIDEVVTAVESMHTATPEKATKRPRRQAAISATEKVAMGYEHDLIPVDKLRRAPDIKTQPEKSRKVDAHLSSATAQLSSLVPQVDLVKEVSRAGWDKNESPSSPPLVVKRGRKPGVKVAEARARKSDAEPEVVELLQAEHMSPAEEGEHALEEVPPCSPKLPAKRGRKPGVKARKLAAAIVEVEQEVLSNRTTKHASPTEEDGDVAEKKPPLSSKLPKKRGRKPGVKALKANVTIDKMQSTMGPTVTEHASEKKSPAATALKYPIDDGSKTQSTRTPRKAKLGSADHLKEEKENTESAERQGRMAESTSKLSSGNPREKQPTKQRRALADFDANIVRKSSTVEDKKLAKATDGSVSSSEKQQRRPRQTRQDLQVKSKSACSSDDEESHEATTASRRRHVIAVEEDLDWLFEKPETKRSVPAAIRHPTTKTRRKEPDKSAKDMDLDDLLASIAGFSGKLLTGRSGRVVAS